MKKLCAIILALALLLSATALASVVPEADKTTLKAGETVNIMLKLDTAIEGIYGLSYELCFDGDLFEYAPDACVAGDAISGIDISGAARTNASGKSYIMVSYFDLTGKGQTVNAGTLYTVAFVAKQDITEESGASFELAMDTACDAELNDITSETVTVPADKASVTVQVEPKPPEVTGITLNKTEATLTVGSTETLTAAVTAEEGADAAVAWSTSDESVATVDRKSVV